MSNYCTYVTRAYDFLSGYVSNEVERSQIKHYFCSCFYANRILELEITNAPVAPWGPLGPSGPLGPGLPAGPASPVAPCGPIGPVAPF